MRRSLSLMRGTQFYVAAAAITFFVRAIASLGRPIARFPDSQGYESLAFFGEVDRLWPVPLMYSIAASDVSRVLLHIVVGTAAWMWLGVVISRISRWPRFSMVAILCIGLSPQIIRYDVTILSESLGISFAVFALAMSIHLLSSSARISWMMWIVSLALCSMTRPTHLVIVAVLLIPYLVVFLRTKGKVITPTFIALFLLLGLGVLQVQANSSTSLLNFYTVLAERIITDDQRYNWFVGRGMPDVEGARDAFGYDYSNDLPLQVANIVQLPVGQLPPTLIRVGGPELAQWAKDSGWRTYLRYVATHPTDTTSRVTSLLNSTLSPPNGDFLPLQNGPMLPAMAFGPWQLWCVLFLMGTAITYAHKSSRRLGQLLLIVGIIVVLIFTATTLTSGIEHPRHGVTVAAMLRVVGLVAVLCAFPQTKARKVSDALDDAPR